LDIALTASGAACCLGSLGAGGVLHCLICVRRLYLHR